MSRDLWPLLGEYSADAIVGALEDTPGITSLRPGTLHDGGPVVRFDAGPDAAGGVGCYSEGEYLIVVGWVLPDAEPEHRVIGPTSRTVTLASEIPAALAGLTAHYTRGGTR